MSSTIITLVSEQGTKHNVPIEFQHVSEFVRQILEDSGASEEIPLMKVNDACLANIIRFCEYHQYDKPQYVLPRPLPHGDLREIVTDQFDYGFIMELKNEEVCEMINACNFLDIRFLLDLCLAKIASQFIGKTYADVIEEYQLPEPTEKDKQALKEEFPWLVEG